MSSGMNQLFLKKPDAGLPEADIRYKSAFS
jgi:hypothetical protein